MKFWKMCYSFNVTHGILNSFPVYNIRTYVSIIHCILHLVRMFEKLELFKDDN